MQLNKNIVIRASNVVAVNEIFVYREMIQLGGGHKWIRGVIVDNANSPFPVYIWQGRSPNIGVATIVLPAWSRAFSIEGTSGIYIVITGPPLTPGITGQIFITVSDEPVTAFASDARNQPNVPIPPIFYPPQTPVI